MKIPSLDEIIQDTKENYDDINNNIALINSQIPTNLTEQPSNTNLLLLIKRYITGLKGTGILIDSGKLSQAYRLVSITDNVTNTTFVRITDLLRVKWEIRLINPNHNLFLIANTDKILDVKKDLTVECYAGNVLLILMQHILDNYGNVDLRMNTKFIPSYNVSNLVASVRGGKNISSYLFEKFCKMWNISYTYTMTSVDNPSYSVNIVMDPSGWV